MYTSNIKPYLYKSNNEKPSKNFTILSFLICQIASYYEYPYGYFRRQVYTCEKCPSGTTANRKNDYMALCNCSELNAIFYKENFECKQRQSHT